jgi:pimeloyl-ACP methyl ester carboxylesterase
MVTGVRLIAIDRPGKGLSAFQSSRRLVDWPDDVVEVATTLRLDRFAVLGISGGGPYPRCGVCSISLVRCWIVRGKPIT